VSHAICRIAAFQVTRPYTLRITFDDGTEREVDLRPMLAGEMYGPLLDEELFNQVAIDPETHTLVWPNRADFDPETLYHWPRYANHLAQMAQEWAAHARRSQDHGT
jgi:hypothetical protein